MVHTGTRHPDGRLRSTVEQDNRMELALGTRSRSGQQYDIWEAVYSPVGGVADEIEPLVG